MTKALTHYDTDILTAHGKTNAQITAFQLTFWNTLSFCSASAASRSS
jgi:hypothetical protein